MKSNRRVGVWVQRQVDHPDEVALLRIARAKPLATLPRLKHKPEDRTRLDGLKVQHSKVKGFQTFDAMGNEDLGRAYRLLLNTPTIPHRDHLLKVLTDRINVLGGTFIGNDVYLPKRAPVVVMRWKREATA